MNTPVLLPLNLLVDRITSPGLYVEFEALYGVNRLATLKRIRMERAYTQFGGVIFCHVHKDIDTVTDLQNKRFIAVAENYFYCSC
ncbi:MAG: hypothetical protein SFW36_13290 [Leptolyngbyaceae cyanobacterium bins.59]|nr:hypothetical protein [Leptolyngbyaceae cyanobacterium bins.59]